MEFPLTRYCTRLRTIQVLITASDFQDHNCIVANLTYVSDNAVPHQLSSLADEESRTTIATTTYAKGSGYCRERHKNKMQVSSLNIQGCPQRGSQFNPVLKVQKMLCRGHAHSDFSHLATRTFGGCTTCFIWTRDCVFLH